MIKIMKGNIIEAETEALVNTVNCVGYMGKGIALQFKQAFPNNFKEYAKICRSKNLKPGKMFVFETGRMFNPKYIINFPTKRHWRGKSRLEDIESGLKTLFEEVKQLNIKSIAIPPLGCGLGGLNWKIIRPIIENTFETLSEVTVFLYEPIATPDAKTMPVRTEIPNMTVARALLIKLMEQYLQLSYRLTLLEIQKLAYFLQEAGEKLRLHYEAGHYGPYADNLNKVLERIEGHFIRGYGDSQKPDVEIDLIPGVVNKANTYLEKNEKTKNRLQKVSGLIEGFETPYGMELLSSVHWVAWHQEPHATNHDSAILAIHNWNERKRKMFKAEHIIIAWNQLEKHGWLGLEEKIL